MKISRGAANQRSVQRSTGGRFGEGGEAAKSCDLAPQQVGPGDSGQPEEIYGTFMVLETLPMGIFTNQ